MECRWREKKRSSVRVWESGKLVEVSVDVLKDFD